jgi:hypothetical protein
VRKLELENEIRAFLAERHPEVLDLALWVRQIVLDAEPDLTERLYGGWDGIGFHHPEAGYVCGLFPRAEEVRLLFEHGARLSDPHGILEGGGTQTRIIRIRDRGDSLGEAIGGYVSEAVGERLFRG